MSGPASGQSDGQQDSARASLGTDIRAYLEHLRVDRGLAANSLAAYARDLRRYQAYCAARGIIQTSQIVGEDVAEYAAHLTASSGGAGMSNTSAARMIVAVRGFHRYAVRVGAAGADAGAGVSAPAADKRPPRALAVADVARILGAVGGPGAGPLSLRDRALLEFLYGTGARISEAVGLDLADLDLPGRTAALFGAGRLREVPLGEAAVAALTGYLQSARPHLVNAVQPAVFLNARGGRLSRQSAWTVLQAAADRARLEVAVSPHTLRHSYAAHLLAAGADPAVVEYLLGHASATTQDHDRQELADVVRAHHPRAVHQTGLTPGLSPS